MILTQCSSKQSDPSFCCLLHECWSCSSRLGLKLELNSDESRVAHHWDKLTFTPTDRKNKGDWGRKQRTYMPSAQKCKVMRVFPSQNRFNALLPLLMTDLSLTPWFGDFSYCLIKHNGLQHFFSQSTPTSCPCEQTVRYAAGFCLEIELTSTSERSWS